MSVSMCMREVVCVTPTYICIHAYLVPFPELTTEVVISPTAGNDPGLSCVS